jgi:uncharacterized membrane protein YeiB
MLLTIIQRWFQMKFITIFSTYIGNVITGFSELKYRRVVTVENR